MSITDITEKIEAARIQHASTDPKQWHSLRSCPRRPGALWNHAYGRQKPLFPQETINNWKQVTTCINRKRGRDLCLPGHERRQAQGTGLRAVAATISAAADTRQGLGPALTNTPLGRAAPGSRIIPKSPFLFQKTPEITAAGVLLGNIHWSPDPSSSGGR